MLYVIPNYICSVYVIYLCPINVLILSDLSRVLLPWKGLLLLLLLLLKNLNHIPEIANSRTLEAEHAPQYMTVAVPSTRAAATQLLLVEVLQSLSKKEKLKFPYQDHQNVIVDHPGP